MSSEIEMPMQNSSNKAIMYAGAAVILVITAIALIWVFSSKYTVLFKDLENMDAAAAVEELEKLKIDYKLQNGGATILVPESQVHQARLNLMASDAKIKSGVGFELFDESDFGMTEYVQKINFQRALQGELSRTISSLNEVKYAKVLLVMRESSLFKKKGETARASVVLFMKEGKVLNKTRIEGIQKLVASSVPGLLTSNVVVSDQDGKTLSRKEEVRENNNVASVGERLQKRKDIEAYLESKALKVLEKAFGPNQALVSIDATINFNKVNTTSETVISDNGGIVRKKEFRKEGKKNNTTKEVEYRVGKVIDQVQMAPGSIERLSIGVIIPEDTARDRINKIRELVGMATGYSEDRGDEIAVHAVALIKQKSIEKPSKVESERLNVEFGQLDESSTAFNEDRDSQRTGQDARENGYSEFVAESEFSEHLVQYRSAVLVLAAGLFVATIVLLAWIRNRRKYQLSIVERENALSQIRVWLDGDDKASISEAKQW